MAEKKYILALDEGTTSARSILFDRDFHVVSMAQNEFTQIYPQPGWVEHDPMEIYASQYASLTECVAKSGVAPAEIAAVGITNQRETTVVWDRHTGRPIYNAIVWQCRRTAPLCEKLIAEGHSDWIAERTGLRPDAYFSGTKIRWILDHVPGAAEKAKAGDLLFGNVDTWLLWKLSEGRIHATDMTNASRTMLYNIEKCCWDEDLLRLLDIPACMLPEVRQSSDLFGHISVMGADIPVGSLVGDQQAALFGQGCYKEGDVKTTYGTGCFVLAHSGQKRIQSSHGLLTTVAATCAGEPVEYALEGSVFVGGAVIQWLRDGMRMIADSADSEYFANKAASTGGVYVVPAFAGLGAPYWDMHARGIIVGVTRGTKPRQLIRASLESIALQTHDVIQAMRKDTGLKMDAIKADGGASANNFLMQFQADISGMHVIRPGSTEATAAGAAALAGLAVGFFENKEEIAGKMTTNAVFYPVMSPEFRHQVLKGWHAAVRACRAFSEAMRSEEEGEE